MLCTTMHSLIHALSNACTRSTILAAEALFFCISLCEPIFLSAEMLRSSRGCPIGHCEPLRVFCYATGRRIKYMCGYSCMSHSSDRERSSLASCSFLEHHATMRDHVVCGRKTNKHTCPDVAGVNVTKWSGRGHVQTPVAMVENKNRKNIERIIATELACHVQQ